MKMLMILPSVGRKKGKAYVKTWQMEPLAIAMLSALTPREIDRIFIDDRLEAVPYDIRVDVVAISVETYTALRAYRIAKRFRKRGIPVIMGGFHATLLTDEVLLHADCVVKGNAESVWEEVCSDFLSGRLKRLYTSENAPFNHPMPDRSVYSSKPYSPLVLIETGRGCPFSCEFCSVTSFFQRKYVARPIGDIIDEITVLRAKTVFFIDDNMVVDMNRTRELLTAVQKLGIHWCGQVSLETAKHPDILELMRKSGCRGVLIGFESLNDANLVQMGKNINRSMVGFDSVETFRRHGLSLYGTFIFGYDQDTPETFENTYRFALDQKLFFAAFNHLVPFPGTPLYRSWESQGRLLYPAWWLSETYRFGDVAFKPKHFSPQELADTCLKYRKKFYSLRSIISRSTDLRANCRSLTMAAIYAVQNIIARIDVDRRQGLFLGEEL
jgi:radical SAM superfamily enzyme YgiQ (UPF0313 family)